MALLWDKSSQPPPLIFPFPSISATSLPPPLCLWHFYQCVVLICLLFLPQTLSASIPQSFLFWCLCPSFSSFPSIACCPLLYVSPPLSSLSSHPRSVYRILRVDRRTLGNLLLSQTFIFLRLIHQSAPRFVFVQRLTKQTARAKAYLFISLNKFAFPSRGQVPAIRGLWNIISSPPSLSHTFHCFLGPSIEQYLYLTFYFVFCGALSVNSSKWWMDAIGWEKKHPNQQLCGRAPIACSILEIVIIKHEKCSEKWNYFLGYH